MFTVAPVPPLPVMMFTGVAAAAVTPRLMVVAALVLRIDIK